MKEKSEVKGEKGSSIKEKEIKNLSSTLTSSEWGCLGVLALLALTLRLYKLNFPLKKIGTEKDAASSIASYLSGIYVLDKKPSLLYMVYSALGVIFGMEVEEIKNNSGILVDLTLKSTSMLRLFNALFSTGLVPLTFVLLKQFGVDLWINLCITMFVVTDSSFILISRYLPNVAISCLISVGLFYSLTSFTKLERDNYSLSWYQNLFMSGILFGLSLSNSDFSILDFVMVFFFMLHNMNQILKQGNREVFSILKIMRFQSFNTFILPVLIYGLAFFISFYSRQNYSPLANKSVSIEFQATLKNNPYISGTEKSLYYGSIIKIRHAETPFGYLSSHNKPYPGGSNQQYVTIREIDSERFSYWAIETPYLASRNYTERPIYPLDGNGLNVTASNLQPLKVYHPKRELRHNDLIRLRHVDSKCYLHSHELRPHFSNQDYINEASCYGFEDFLGDENDNFRIQLRESIDDKIEKIDEEDKELFQKKRDELRKSLKPILAFQSKFRFHHDLTDGNLYSRPIKLGDYSKLNKTDDVSSYEVFTIRDSFLPRSLFEVVYNLPPIAVDEDGNIMDDIKTDPLVKELIEDTIKPVPSSLFSKISEVIQRTLYQSDNTNFEQSNIIDWLLLKKGVTLFKSGKELIYFITNPLHHILGTFSVLFYLTYNFILLLINKRYQKRTNSQDEDDSSYLTIISYGCHFIPWLFIKDKSLISYTLSYYFSLLLFGLSLDQMCNKMGGGLAKKGAAILLMTLSLLSYYSYSKIIYGLNSDCNPIFYSKNWDISCNSNEAEFDPIFDSDVVNTVIQYVDKDGNLIVGGGEDENVQEVTEEKIVYVDQFGNKIEEEIKEKIVYVDENGNEIQPHQIKEGGVKEEIVYVDENGNKIEKDVKEEIVYVDEKGNKLEPDQVEGNVVKQEVVYVDQNGAPIPKKNEKVVVEVATETFFATEEITVTEEGEIKTKVVRVLADDDDDIL
ncbi:hypothetical protein K502DRAFT_326342 [Neoconidiobolus thromboides FSU 785]|nr:hypothetical protein K502DRAFT_326342 [Neoconidiobolus thromboides FSU 785]